MIAFNQNKDEESLKNLVMAETSSFFNRDAEAWQKTWLHSERISRTYIAKDKYTTLLGWNDYSSQMDKFFKENPKQFSVEVKNDSFNISYNDSLAWVEYRQTAKTAYPQGNKINVSREYRVVTKDSNHEWKILSMITFDTLSSTSKSSPDIENNLNSAGHDLLTANRINDAIDVFLLNTKLFPASWRTYNSLGEAYQKAGNNKKAIENYEKALKLNPQNNRIMKALDILNIN